MGLELKLTYSDGSIKYKTDGFTTSGFDSSDAGTSTVTVRYEGKATSYTVTIEEEEVDPTLTSISISTKPSKLTYKIDESLSTTGMVVTATYSDGSKRPVTGYTTGDYSVSVSNLGCYNYNEESVTVLSYSGKVSVAKSTVAVEGVSLSSSSIEIRYKDSAKLTATVVPANATTKTVTYTSSDTAVATVSATGLITAKAAGTATITVSTVDGSKTATCVVTVINPTITIQNHNKITSIKYGETLKLTAETVDMPEGAKVAWSVQGSGVTLKASEDGMSCDVTSTASGTVTVIAQIVDADDKPITDAEGNEIAVTQQIKSNAGFFQKLASFFKNLFRISRIIVQFIDQ